MTSSRLLIALAAGLAGSALGQPQLAGAGPFVQSPAPPPAPTPPRLASQIMAFDRDAGAWRQLPGTQTMQLPEGLAGPLRDGWDGDPGFWINPGPMPDIDPGFWILPQRIPGWDGDPGFWLLPSPIADWDGDPGFNVLPHDIPGWDGDPGFDILPPRPDWDGDPGFWIRPRPVPGWDGDPGFWIVPLPVPPRWNGDPGIFIVIGRWTGSAEILIPPHRVDDVLQEAGLARQRIAVGLPD